MRWQETFYFRPADDKTAVFESVCVCFGMFGLYGHLEASFDGYEAAKKSRQLDRGEHVIIGKYEVFKDCCYYSENNY